MSIVAIIPARGGSKRIPRKNIKDFLGKPIIAYSIDVALKCKIFDKVVVSTDDDEIANVAVKYGAEVVKRSNVLSNDFVGTQEVIEHAISVIETSGIKVNYVCAIFATAPFIQEKYLIEGLKKLKSSDAVNAFSVTSMPFPIQRAFKIKNDRCEMFWPEKYLARSQDLEEAYQDAGQFYWTKLNIDSNCIMFSEESIPIVLPRYLVQDIDTFEDWERAELMYKVLRESNS